MTVCNVCNFSNVNKQDALMFSHLFLIEIISAHRCKKHDFFILCYLLCLWNWDLMQIKILSEWPRSTNRPFLQPKTGLIQKLNTSSSKNNYINIFCVSYTTWKIIHFLHEYRDNNLFEKQPDNIKHKTNNL